MPKKDTLENGKRHLVLLSYENAKVCPISILIPSNNKPTIELLKNFMDCSIEILSQTQVALK